MKLTETLKSEEEGRQQEQSGDVSDSLEDGNQMTKLLGQSWSQSCSRSGRFKQGVKPKAAEAF